MTHPLGSDHALSKPIALDGGTSTRAAPAKPGPIGLDAKDGGAKNSAVSLGDQIVSFARQRIGRRIGDGECFALADQALRNAQAKSAADYGTVTLDADYVWGNEVTLSDARPGDIIQFRDYRYERTIVTETASETTTHTDFQERPHHTAIVESVGAQGALTVLEQNVPHRGSIHRTELFFSNAGLRSGNRTTSITVRGSLWFYRPQPR